MMFVESQEYGQDQMEKPYQFWMPLIGLYTGMRIEEICQLYVSDLKKIDGIWCFDINQNKPDKSVKTSERRIVPLHPFLAEELNFVGYVKSLPDQKDRIFPELKRIKNRYSHHACKPLVLRLQATVWCCCTSKEKDLPQLSAYRD